MTPQAIVPAVVIPALYAWVFYRRVRRNFGRQPLQPTRFKVRIGILTLAAGALLFVAANNAAAFSAALAGLVVGAGLGVIGLRLTRFESSAEGFFYTQNTYIGVGLSALLIGRLVYRYLVMSQSAGPTASMTTGQYGTNPFAASASNALTLAIFTLLVGYYVTYFVGVLIRAHKTPVT